MKRLLTTSNPKTAKSVSQGWLTGILHLAPASLSGANVCPWATDGCRAGCLNKAGRGAFDRTQQSRIEKTRMFQERRQEFLDALRKDIGALVRRADRLGLRPAVRLNGTSDVCWEASGVGGGLFQSFPEVQFYDYTKSPDRALKSKLLSRWPSNYHLTYSRRETDTVVDIQSLRDHGVSIAVVFDQVPDRWLGIPVASGDETDLRFLDAPGSIIGVRAKGPARKDRTGFVIRQEATIAAA